MIYLYDWNMDSSNFERHGLKKDVGYDVKYLYPIVDKLLTTCKAIAIVKENNGDITVITNSLRRFVQR